MFSSLLTATVLASTAFSLTASPSAYDNAQAQHSYALRIANTGHSTETVYSQFGRGILKDGHCTVDFSHPDRYGWAKLQGAPEFRLRPGQMRTVRVSIAQPPPGKFELVATWLTRTGGSAQIHTAAGVGTALRFTEPGKTRIQPCPHVEAAKAGGPGVLDVVGLAFVGACTALLCAALWLRRQRRRGHAA